MRTFGFVTLAFVVGFVAGFAGIVFGMLAWMDYAEVFDRDGGLAMGVFFTLGPIGGVVVGTVAAIVTGLRLRRKQAEVATGARPPSRRWPLGVRAAVAAVAWAAGAWGVVSAFFWLNSPMVFESYETAVMVSWLPIAIPLAAALLAAGFVFWRRAPGVV